MKKLNLHAAKAGGVNEEVSQFVLVKKLILHAAKAGGVNEEFSSH